MRFSVFELCLYDKQWWVGIFNLEVEDFDGHLLYVEHDHGYWKLDFLWLRPLWLSLHP